MSTRQLGYIAISRSIFEHPLFKNRDDWTVAWVKLIAAAAWKPQAHSGRWGSAHVNRGQLANTVRGLAAMLGLSKASAEYFLRRLLDAQMIAINVVRTRMNTGESVKNSQRISIITICNYDKFQVKPRLKNDASGQGTRQRAGQENPNLPGIIEEVDANQHNQSILNGKEATETRLLGKPNHGARSKCGKYHWLDYGTSDWQRSAEDFRNVKGSDIFPETRIEGRGNWFVYLGEAARPKRGKQRRTA